MTFSRPRPIPPQLPPNQSKFLLPPLSSDLKPPPSQLFQSTPPTLEKVLRETPQSPSAARKVHFLNCEQYPSRPLAHPFLSPLLPSRLPCFTEHRLQLMPIINGGPFLSQISLPSHHDPDLPLCGTPPKMCLDGNSSSDSHPLAGPPSPWYHFLGPLPPFVVNLRHIVLV